MVVATVRSTKYFVRRTTSYGSLMSRRYSVPPQYRAATDSDSVVVPSVHQPSRGTQPKIGLDPLYHHLSFRGTSNTHWFSSTASQSDRSDSGGGDDKKLWQRIDDINQYVTEQIKAMQLFETLMQLHPDQSPDPANFGECRDRLHPLVYQRTPPKIQEEMGTTATPSAATSPSSSSPPSSLLPMEIRQSKLYTQLAIATLRRGYYNAKGHPWMIGWSMVQGNDEKYHNPESFYIQRYQGSWRYDVVKRMPTAPKVGTIIMYDDVEDVPLVAEYHRNLRTHFSNAPAFPKPHTTSIRPLGKVHVAMGFNDLQILLEHVDDGMAMANQSSAPPQNGVSVPQLREPMLFIGYDRSTYSIAKTLVIAQMLQQSAVSPHHIIEAWYSSTWNYETFMLFRYTCIALLKDDGYVNPHQSILSYPTSTKEEIRQYLYHWAYDAVPISAIEAIQRWMLESTKNGSVYTQTCSFHRHHDRISLLHYFITGEFNSSNKNQSNTEMVGSLAMWSVPASAPPSNLNDQDRVNNTILVQSILDEIRNLPDDTLSIMDAMYNIKLRQVTKLQRAVQNNEIQVDIRYGDIQTLDKANLFLVDEIRDLKATTMSWSNLVDYFEMGAFHEMVHHWSSCNSDGTRTTHYGYTMNWPTICYGTSISDYNTRKERRIILFATIETAIQESEETGLGELITMPTFEHTEDQTGEWLAKQLRPKWVEYFIKEGQELLPVNRKIVVHDDMQLHFPILRTNRSIYLTWTYQ